MKIYIKSNSNNGYLYIFKHGIGPGTIPNDVSVVKVKDLPNYYTAVWLDRFLTTDELRQYDIPDETKINMYLDRIGYCQKNGDVVPCDDIEACDKVTSAIMLDDEDSEYIASQVENELRITCRDDGNCIYIFSDEDGVKSPFSYTELNGYYTRLLKNGDYHRFKPVKKSIQYFEDKVMELTSSSNSDEEFKNNYRNFLINFLGLPSVEACDKVIASEICYRDRDNDDRVVALDVGMSDEDVEEMLAAHPSYYRSTLDRFDDVDACDNVMASSGIFYTDQGAGIGSRNQVFTEDDLKAAFNSLLAEGDPIATSYNSFEAWRDATLDSGLLGVEFLDEDVENPDIDFDETDIDATTEPKYFANMVSASNDPELDDNFLVEGYYDNQRRGLAESAETSDVSALNELIYEYANKGYYIVVYNLTDGVITEFSADNWFDDLARDGGAGLFMS